jgi:hypothetical protein
MAKQSERYVVDERGRRVAVLPMSRAHTVVSTLPGARAGGCASATTG